MAEKSQVFDQTYEDYLSQIAGLDFNFIADTLGVKVDGGDVIVPLFGKSYRVSAQSITDSSGQKPHLAICVILCKYLLMCPLIESLGGNWMASSSPARSSTSTSIFTRWPAWGKMREVFAGSFGLVARQRGGDSQSGDQGGGDER